MRLPLHPRVSQYRSKCFPVTNLFLFHCKFLHRAGSNSMVFFYANTIELMFKNSYKSNNLHNLTCLWPETRERQETFLCFFPCQLCNTWTFQIPHDGHGQNSATMMPRRRKKKKRGMRPAGLYWVLILTARSALLGLAGERPGRCGKRDGLASPNAARAKIPALLAVFFVVCIRESVTVSSSPLLHPDKPLLARPLRDQARRPCFFRSRDPHDTDRAKQAPAGPKSMTRTQRIPNKLLPEPKPALLRSPPSAGLSPRAPDSTPRGPILSPPRRGADGQGHTTTPQKKGKT
jgi:hypothetical protein